VEDAEQVDRAPDRGVEEDARLAGKSLRKGRQVGDAAVGDDQLRLGIAVDKRGELTGDRRQTAAAVDQDRNATLRGQSEDRREALVVQEEALRSGVELDPASAEIEAAGGLLDRLLGQVEADERDQLAAGALCIRERSVVRRPKRRMPVRFVEAEHEAA